MRFPIELDMAVVLALTACAGAADRSAFHERLFRFATAGDGRAPMVEPARLHSPALCQGLVLPTSFVGPFRHAQDYGRLRELCIRR